MCDTENRFAKSKLSLDSLGIDPHFAVNGSNERLYSDTPDAPLNHHPPNGANPCELLNGSNLNAGHLADLSAQKQIADLATGQTMRLTDNGQLNSGAVCDSEIVNSTVLDAMHRNVTNSSTGNCTSAAFAADNQNGLNNQNTLKSDCTAGSGQMEHGVPANATLSNSAGNHLASSNDGSQRAIQCGTNGSTTTNGADTGSSTRFTASSKPSNEPSSTENASPTSKSSESSSPAETPKRLHVSNIPFKYHDEHLRQLFSVSYAYHLLSLPGGRKISQ